MLEVHERCSEGIIVLFTLTIFYMCAADHFRTNCSRMESKRAVSRRDWKRKTRDRKALVLCWWGWLPAKPGGDPVWPDYHPEFPIMSMTSNSQARCYL